MQVAELQNHNNWVAAVQSNKHETLTCAKTDNQPVLLLILVCLFKPLLNLLQSRIKQQKVQD